MIRFIFGYAWTLKLKSTDSKVSGYVWMGPRKRRVAHAYNIKLLSGEVWRIIDQFDILKFTLKQKTSAHRQPLWYACRYKEALEALENSQHCVHIVAKVETFVFIKQKCFWLGAKTFFVSELPQR